MHDLERLSLAQRDDGEALAARRLLELVVRPLSRAVPLTRRRGAAPCRAEVSELRDQLRQRTVELQEAVSFGMGIEWIM